MNILDWIENHELKLHRVEQREPDGYYVYSVSSGDAMGFFVADYLTHDLAYLFGHLRGDLLVLEKNRKRIGLVAQSTGRGTHSAYILELQDCVGDLLVMVGLDGMIELLKG